MKLKIPLFPALAILAILLAACVPAATPAPTPTASPSPSPSPTPFGKYGQALMDVTYCTMDGQPQKMDLYFPGSGGPWPVFLYVHGGGWNQGDKAEGAGWKFLNAQGYLVVSVNYRLAAYNVKFPAMIEDVKCAVRSLRAHAVEYNLNPNRIGALGASAGGHLVALLGTSDKSAGWDVGEYPDQSSRVQAVVAEAVFSDFSRPINDSMQMAIYYAFGDFPGTDSRIDIAASPVSYITADDPPFLIIHGDKDGYAPPDQAQTLDAKLKAAGVPSQLVMVQNATHGLTSWNGNTMSPSAEEINQIILDFLNKNLMK
jgi:acetyl esterase/lipase